ncbi:MAG TPA: tetratricopeptide repeat protein [Bryobacteraceae bacterium]|nr:tetratricopeptide repeat protein [Bryobacteraceae bacterium]
MRGLLCLLACVALAAAAPPRSPVVNGPGFDHFYNLEYDAAIAEFARDAALNPQSPDARNHLAMAVLYRAMLRSGALESELVTGNNPFVRRQKVEASLEDRQEFETSVESAISLAEARLKADPKDVNATYALGVAYGLRANYKFLVRKAWRDALKDATTARKHHNRVTELNPSFIDAKLIQGLHDFVVGSLPWGWKMLGFLIGFRGDKEKGIQTLELVASQGGLNRVDAEILLCAVYRRERQTQRAIPLLEDLIRRFPRNYLLPMELAQMFSDLGDKDKALAALDHLERQIRLGRIPRDRVRPERISFARGNIQFWYGDLDDALVNLRRAAAAAEDLDLHTGVLAWMRLGQVYDLRRERAAARKAYERAIVFAPDSDAARESRGYLAKAYERDEG